ncbi:MAG: hypothetical protein ACT4PE_06320 [Candidatus Eiseniibacteriota bacterium]
MKKLIVSLATLAAVGGAGLSLAGDSAQVDRATACTPCDPSECGPCDPKDCVPCPGCPIG